RRGAAVSPIPLTCSFQFKMGSMKKLFVIAVCAGAIMLQAFRSDEDKNKGFAKMVFECIRKGDSVGFKKFFVTAIQFDSLVDKSTWTDEERERNKKRFTQHFLDSVIPITYHDIHSEYALNWKNVVVDSIIIK